MLSANDEGHSGGNLIVRIDTDTGIYQLSLVSGVAGVFDPQGGAIMLQVLHEQSIQGAAFGTC